MTVVLAGVLAACGGGDSPVSLPSGDKPDASVEQPRDAGVTTSDAGGCPDNAPECGGQDAGSGTDTDAGMGSGADAGGSTDAGRDSGVDAGSGATADAGTDSGTDAGSGADTDAGTGSDAGADTDAGTGFDAGSDTDAGTGIDAGANTDAGTGIDAGSGPGTGDGGTGMSDGGTGASDGGTASLSVDAGADQRLCVSGSVRIGPEPEAGLEYSWTPAAGLSSATEARPTAFPSETTTYVLTVRSPATGATGTDAVVVTVHGLPVAKAGMDATVCAGGPVTLGEPVSEALTYEWSPAESLSAADSPQPEARPGTTTTYTLTVKDANGCSASDDVTVTVHSLPVARISAPAKVCGGSAWNLSAAASTATEPATLTGYAWTFSSASGTTQVSGLEPVFPTSTAPSSVQALLSVMDSNGCVGSASLVGSVLARPVADAGVDRTLSRGASTQVGAPATGGAAPYTYAWSASPTCAEGPCLSNASAVQPTVSPAEDTRFTVNVTDAEGCTSSDSVDVTVIPPLRVNAGADRVLCSGQSTSLGGAATGGTAPYTYAWSASPDCTGCLSSTSSATVTATPSVTTTFTQSATDAAGATAASSVVVSVSPPPGSVSGSRYLDPGASVSMGPAPVTGATYAWRCNRADCALSRTDVAQPVAGPRYSTTYTLEARGAEGCVATSSQTLWVSLQASTVPAEGEGEPPFPVSSPLLVQFDQPIDVASLNTATVTLTDALTDAPVAVSLTYDADNRRLWVKPTGSNYAAGGDYTLTLVGGPTGIVSSNPVQPNFFSSDVQVDFITAAADTTAPGISFRSPAAGATGVASNASVVVIFTESVDPSTVTAARFTLTGAGAVAGTVRYDAANATATFIPSAPLAFSASYTVALSGITDLSGNPLNTSWTFTTGVAPDTTPPSVTAVSPASGATGVVSSTPLHVTFSEDVDGTSLSGIRLLDVAAGTQVAGTLAYNATTRVATFMPTVLLGSLRTYEVNVTTVKDLAGNAMAAAFTSRFTTRTTLFFDDFESGSGAWTMPAPATGTAWSLVTNSFHSANHSLTESAGGKYAANVQSYAVLTQPLSVNGLSSVTVQFWMRARTERNKDFLYVETSLDGGAWTPLANGRYSGKLGWAVRSLPLPLAGASRLQLRFRFESNANKAFDGVYIDDV